MNRNENNLIYEGYQQSLQQEKHGEDDPMYDFINNMSGTELLDKVKNYDEDAYHAAEAALEKCYKEHGDQSDKEETVKEYWHGEKKMKEDSKLFPPKKRPEEQSEDDDDSDEEKTVDEKHYRYKNGEETKMPKKRIKIKQANKEATDDEDDDDMDEYNKDTYDTTVDEDVEENQNSPKYKRLSRYQTGAKKVQGKTKGKSVGYKRSDRYQTDAEKV